jgi:hypothetical protein
MIFIGSANGEHPLDQKPQGFWDQSECPCCVIGPIGFFLSRMKQLHLLFF